MGIQGLIPFLEKSSKPINVKQFSGNTVAIDAYCWLHKGVFSCADKLARGEDCRSYVYYCMKFINMLLSYNIKPILVFDGQKLSAKMNTEKKRKELREQSRKKATELMRMDRGKEALVYLRQCVDVTHEMALNLIRVCRSRNVDCIVAPYEADAQLAFLNIRNIAQVVITEDSDLLLFGSKKVLFKMDINGNGLLIEQDNLYLSMDERPESFSFDKFRYMCILSGCDYLPSLPGIGLVKACRFVKRTVDPDIHRAISRIGSHLNMPSLKISQEYRDNFLEADFMFKYQPVFDPATRKLVPLTTVSEEDDNYKKFSALIAANNLSPEQVYHLAYGNLDPFSLRQLDDWVPGQKLIREKHKNGNISDPVAKHPSIWNPDFVPHEKKNSISAAPNALRPMKPVTNSNYVSEKTSCRIVSSTFQQEEKESSEQNFNEQLEKLKNIYEVNDAKNNGEYSDSVINSQSSNDDLKSQNSSFSDNSSLTSSFIENDADKSSSKIKKIRSALSKFARSCTSESDENSSEVVSGYFSLNSSFATESSATISPNRTTQSPVKSLHTNTSGSKSPIISLRSPLKVKNNDDDSHPTSPVKILNPESAKSDNSGVLNSNAKKRLNPFAVTNPEKSVRIDFDECGRNSRVEFQNSGSHKRESTFKWAERMNSSVTSATESTNGRWSVATVDVDVASATKFDENDQPEPIKKVETSPIISTSKSSYSRSSLPSRIGSKCRTLGLVKKPNLKQQSLLSSFICSKPHKMKL